MNSYERGLNPTPEWTQEERTKIAISIAMQLREKAAEGFVDNAIVFDASERIAMVLNMPSTFLEENKRNMLNGQPPAEPPIKA